MSEENIHVDTLVTEDMSKDELYDYAKYLEYRKEELLNINHSLQQKVEQLEKENEATLKNYGNLVKEWKQLENIRKEVIDLINKNSQYPTYYLTGNIVKDLLNILNKGDNNVKD